MLKSFGAFSFTVFVGLALSSLQAWAEHPAVKYDDAIVSASQFDQDLLQQNNGQDIAMFIPNIQIGDSQRDINSWLGKPYSVSSLEDGSVWDYNVSIPRSYDSFMGCQYRMEFDAEGRLRQVDWRKSVCDLLYQQYIAQAGDIEPRMEVFSFTSDVLFPFNEYRLKPSGQAMLDEFVAELLARYDEPMITVTGHTDRLGPEEANQRLSERRAREVGKRFLEQGQKDYNLLIKGVGENMPVVECVDDQRDAELIECLQPNRRVEIEIYEKPAAS
ncbi:OmpA family protein [Marinomonas ostreistagni]|uniref:OmpA family protein n=1 Tax=Marinomonas ostreistagni TaxID=359209 RepID=UPI001950A67E|nr:OmpA family protein [Marinomonas ostreistagni]MBM6551069.1 OmpA family protein [Marinomonas ostreistagni]